MARPHTFGEDIPSRDEVYSRLRDLYRPTGYTPLRFSADLGSGLHLEGEYRSFGREGEKGSFQMVSLYTERDTSDILEQGYRELQSLEGDSSLEDIQEPLYSYENGFFRMDLLVEFNGSSEVEKFIESYIRELDHYI